MNDNEAETDAKPISGAARRALAEADERRKKGYGERAGAPIEKLGRNGPDPVRYGDWEKDGIVSDF